jgi:hypothetical protein
VAYRKALDLAGTAPERDLLRRKLNTVEQRGRAEDDSGVSASRRPPNKAT